MSDEFDCDLNFFYFGGSGGFLFLHLLLLKEQHWCYLQDRVRIPSFHGVERSLLSTDFTNYLMDLYKLPEGVYNIICKNDWPSYNQYLSLTSSEFLLILSNQDQSLVKTIIQSMIDSGAHSNYIENTFYYPEVYKKFILPLSIKHQWNTNRPSWKFSEIWPQNEYTQQTKIPINKIYFNCNDIDYWKRLPGKKVFLWADANYRMRMAWHKGTAMFFKNGDSDRLIRHRREINKIKEHYQQTISDTCATADISINIRDLLDGKILKFNNAQQNLVAHWKSQHPKSLLTKLGIEN